MSNLLELVEMGVKAEMADFKEGAEEKLSLLDRLGFSKVVSQMKGRLDRLKKEKAIHYHGYIKIMPENITKFLQAKANAYNEKYKFEAPPVETSALRSALWHAARMQVGGSLTEQALQAQMEQEYLTDAGSWHMTRGARDAYYRAAVQQLERSRSLNSMFGPGYSDMVAPPPPVFLHNFTAHTIHASSNDPKKIGKFVWEEVKVGEYGGVPPTEVLEAFEMHKERNCFDYFTISSVKGIPDPLLLGRLNGSEARYFCAQWGEDVALDDLI